MIQLSHGEFENKRGLEPAKVHTYVTYELHHLITHHFIFTIYSVSLLTKIMTSLVI